MKQKRYWLRGGIIMVVFSVIIIFTTGYILPSFQLLISGDGLFSKVSSDANIFIVPLLIPDWFIIGVILGWIYGKIKNRKN